MVETQFTGRLLLVGTQFTGRLLLSQVARNTTVCIALIQRKTSNTHEVCTAPAFVPWIIGTVLI